MIQNSPRFIVFVTILQAVAIALFLRAFLRLPQNPIANEASSDNLSFSSRIFDKYQNLSCPLRSSPPIITHLSIVLIDALAARFVIHAEPHLHNAMPFLYSHSTNSIIFTANAQTPTVTLPRIKAITTGTIPSFADVALNFAASNLTADSWVRRTAPVVFYGDDTWMRLFPDALAPRSEGTTSFFVADYTEVDTNVTRHLDGELISPLPWRTLILHYLGLDHIGHSFGGRSPLIIEKLKEMDGVIGRIFMAMSQEKNSRPLMIILGDHGMTEHGSHGGSSSLETQVPVMFLSPMINEKENKPYKMEQLDLASTISHLTGTSPPIASLSNPPIEVFRALDWSELHTLDIQYTTLVSLCSQLTVSDEWLETECASLPKRHGELLLSMCEGRDGLEGEMSEIGERYSYVLRQVQRVLMESSAEYDITSMLFAIIFGALAAIGALWNVLGRPTVSYSNRFDFTTSLTITSTIIHPLTYLSTSFIEEEHNIWYYSMTTALAVVSVASIGIRSKNRVKAVGGGVLCLALHRVLCQWQSTGDKWAHLPDIQDWLEMADQNVIRLTLAIISIIILAHRISITSRHSSIIWITAAFAIVFRYAEFNGQRGLLPARGVYFFSILHGLIDRRLSSSLLLFLFVIVRPAQLPCIVIIYLLTNIISSINEGRSTQISYLLLGCAWFYAGGSNQISSLDISRGYIGLADYNSVIVASLILLNAYACLVGVCCALPRDVSLLQYVMAHRALLLTISMITTFINREHLFVWSVFAPKLVFDTLHWTVAVVLFLLTLLSDLVKSTVVSRRKMK